MMNQPALIPSHKYRIPEYFPPELRQELAEVIDLNLWAEIRKAARRPVRVRVSEWALKNREVTEGSNPGPWRHELAPHTVKIMDTFGLPWVQEVWLCKVEQSGGTNSIINCLLQSADCDPGDAFMLMPTEKDSNKIVGRLKNTLKASRNVCDLVSHRADDTTLENIKLLNGMTIFPAHANSPASMSSRPAKYAFGDEVDKYPALAGREADPITLIRKRGRTFRGRVKRFFGSTPAGQFIHKGTYSCHQVWRYDVKCPHCGALVWMDAEHLVIPEDTTPDTADTVEIGYACNTCAAIWTETDRISAIHSGRWICIKGEDEARPARVGFHHRAWECLDVPLHEIAAAYLRAQTGDLAAKIAWANGYEAVDYEPTKATEDYKDILALCDDRPRDLVPDWAAAMGMVVDTQEKGFYYEVNAMSYANEDGVVTSALVRHGYLLTFSDLINMVDRTWRTASGRDLRIPCGLIDSGGRRRAGMPQKHSRTKEVYEFCLKNPRFRPLKGRERSDTPVRYTNLTRWPGTNKPIPGGLQLIVLDVHYYKDDLAGRLKIAPDDPGSFVLYSGYTADQLKQMEQPGFADLPNGCTDYAKHLCSEYRDELGNWKHDKKAGRNDFADIATYRMYMIDLYLQGGMLTRSQPKQKKTEKNKSKNKQSYRRW